MICLHFASDDVIPGKHNKKIIECKSIDSRSRKNK